MASSGGKERERERERETGPPDPRSAPDGRGLSFARISFFVVMCRLVG